jgi:putative ABC transport system ATP-binding protein
MNSVIAVSSLCKYYRTGSASVRALADVDIAIRNGEFVTIQGRSGSGKTTLLNLLGCIDRPTSGTIVVAGRDVTSLSDAELSHVRNSSIGFVFQFFGLMQRMTVLENIELPVRFSRNNPVEVRNRALGLAERFGLTDRLHHRPPELSGGQAQRVAIARALVMGPAVVLADEPTGNLDSSTAAGVMRELHEVNAAGTAVVVVTHDDLIAEHGCRRIRIEDGRIVSDEQR